MAQCDACGNDYPNAFQVVAADGQRHTFDSIECAARVMAPRCENCDVRILGHGLQAGGRMFCCAHCARAEGVEQLTDHVN